MQITKNSPIGIFDSGLGGLSVLQCIREQLPHESLIYVADTAHIPYGDKSAEYILERSQTIAEFFQDQGVKAIVVACNTATAAAIKQLRRDMSIPIIGMEPGIKPAIQNTRSGVVGVLATQSTLASDKFRDLLGRFHTDAKFLIQPCPGLVELIEQGRLDHLDTRTLLESYLNPLIEADADTIVLGCTHYPFLKPLIRELAQDKIQLVDTGAAVAAQLQRQLETHGLHATGGSENLHRFFSSDRNDHLQKTIEQLLGEKVELERLSEQAVYTNKQEIVS